MSEPAITSAPSQKPSEPASDRLGGGVYYAIEGGLELSPSRGGGPLHTIGAQFTIPDYFEERFSLNLQTTFGTTDQKIYPITEFEGTTADHHHWNLMLGLGRSTRNASCFGDGDDFKFALVTETLPLFGFGNTTVSLGDVPVDGVDVEYDDASDRTFDIGTTYFVSGELSPWQRGVAFKFGPIVHYGVQYAGEGSGLGGLNLTIGFMLSGSFEDASSISREETGGELGAMGIVQGLYATLHAFLQRYMLDLTLTKPTEALEEYGLLGDDEGATDRGSMADVPLLTGAGAFLASSNTPFTPALRSGEFGYWGFGALGAAGGIYFLAAGSDSTKASGLADLLGTARLLGYAFAGINTPTKRLGKLPESVEKRQMSINLVSYAVNTAVMLIGAGADSGIAMGGGSGANMSIAMSPDPVEETMVERTDIGYIPYTGFWSNKVSGNRSGIIIHKGWHDVPSESFQLFSSAMLISPMLTFGNLGNMPAEDEEYDSVMATSDVGATLGLEWKTRFTRLLFGIDTRGVFGDDDADVGLGGMAGFDFVIPFNGEEDGSGLSLGARGTVHKLFPEGWQAEIAPWFGLTLHL